MKKDQCSINFMAIACLANKKIVVDFVPHKLQSQSNVFRHSTKEIIEKLLLISITPNERHTESLNGDTKIFSVVDKSVTWAFVTIVISDFPERVGYKMLSELEEKALNSLNTVYLTKLGKDNIQSAFKSYADDIQLSMVELERKYRDLTRNDKIRGLQSEVNTIQTNMKSNLNQMVMNLEVVSDLENKASLLKDKAKDFKDNAQELSNVTWWANKKMNIVIGGVSLIGVGYAVFKIFF